MSLVELTRSDYVNQNWKEIERIVKENQISLDLQDQKAKDKGEIIGRYISVITNDGYAYYEIVDKHDDKVRLRLIRGLGNDNVYEKWGKNPLVDKDYVLLKLKYKDK